MLVNTQWLKEWVAFDIPVDELSHRLTMAGLEVDSAQPFIQCDDHVVVGQVKSVKPHAQSDRLSVCSVDVGRETDLQIVCGAPNVSAGGKYPVALIGSSIKGQKIKNVSIRSVPSQGMLCSAQELEFEDTAAGLMTLDADAPVGTSINQYLNRNDTVLDIELTPNRADCLSIRGVAREIAILERSNLVQRDEPRIAAQSEAQIPVQIKNPEDCPVFCRRIIENMRTDATTPDWMKQRLQRVGLRSIHPIVDITNYVMIELGQPMHAFDTELINASEIIVRHCEPGERLELLDGETLNLGDHALLIANQDGPIALAGVMGGLNSGIRDQTQNIMLEAAFFSPDAIRRSVSKFGLHTDASHRFERGVDPTGQSAAIERATQLILQVAGGIPGPTQEFRTETEIQMAKRCLVRHSRVNRVLGTELSCGEIESILHLVNESVVPNNEGWEVVPPVWRFDLTAEHDQIEEVARIYGYDNVPSRTKFEPGLFRNLSEQSVSPVQIRETLHALGYQEAITYSFVDPALQDKIKPDIEALQLANPIAENLSVMRTSLWPGLVGGFLENYRRNKDSIRLYEIGRVFHPSGEINMLGGLVYGSKVPLQWGGNPQSVDYFDMKGDLETLLDLTGKTNHLEFRFEAVDGLHPGRCSSIFLDSVKVGAAGQLHPNLLAEVDSTEAVYVFEIEIEPLLSKLLTKYIKISRYPYVLRDLSLVVDINQNVSEIEATIRQSAGNDLESATLFDVYYQVNARNNIKSIAYRLKFRSKSRTLTDFEIDTAIENILDQLNYKYDAKLRV